MPLEDIVLHCSPTLAGLKTGNLFSTCCTSREELKMELRELNHLLNEKGLRIIPLWYNKNKALIYIYRPDRLKKDLCQQEAEAILQEKGYQTGDASRCLIQLIRRFTENLQFPHEIGLFLGYPPSDVRGFIKSPCDGVKCTGCWKVYGNKEEALKTFQKYRTCTQICYKQFLEGVSLEQLIDQASLLQLAE